MKNEPSKVIQRYTIALTFLVVVLIIGFIIIAMMYRDIRSLQNAQSSIQTSQESNVSGEEVARFFNLNTYFTENKFQVRPLKSVVKLEGEALENNELYRVVSNHGVGEFYLYKIVEVVDSNQKPVGSLIHVFEEELGEYRHSTWFVEGDRLVVFTGANTAEFGNIVRWISQNTKEKRVENISYDITTTFSELYPNYREPNEVTLQNGVVLEPTTEKGPFDSGFDTSSLKGESIFSKEGVELYPNNGVYRYIRPDFSVVNYRAPGPLVTPEGYGINEQGGCGASIGYASFPKDMTITMADLTPYRYEGIYIFKNKNHKFLKDRFAISYVPGLTFEQYVEKDPVLVWKDAFGEFRPMYLSAYGPQTECGKPVIYLYPEKTQEVSVQVAPEGGFSFTEPLYNNGWKVLATPEGKLTNLSDGKTYPYLFWEGTGGTYEAPKTGFVVAKADVEKTLREKLSYMGLNETEIADFVEFWLPRMQAHPYYVIGFHGTRVMDYLAPLTISPKPDSVFRILMDYRGVSEPIEITEPVLPQFKREGFAVVEWGGVLQRVGNR